MTSKTLLIADDDQPFLQLLASRCEELGWAVRTASDGLEALMLGVHNAPDLFILDVKLPGTDGLSLCKRFRKDPQTAAIPIIILTGLCDHEIEERCRALGARYVHKNLEIWDKLGPIMHELLEFEPGPERRPNGKEGESARLSAEPSTPKVLVIDDDPQITRAIMIRLGALGIDVIRSPNAKVGSLLARTEGPDLIITDYRMPDVSGEQLLIDLKDDPETMDIPVIVLTGARLGNGDDFALRWEMLGRRGAVAYLTKPVDFDVLLDELRRHVSIPSRC